MIYNRNEGVKSILNARLLEEPVETNWQTRALFKEEIARVKRKGGW